MGFWETLNADIEKVFSKNSGSAPVDASGLPESDSDVSAVLSALEQAESVVPNYSPGPIVNQSPGNPSDPFQMDTSKLIQVQSLNNFPFSVIDITPSTAAGTINKTVNSGPATPNQFPTTFQTLTQIANILASKGINTTAADLAANGANLPGVTYQYAVSGVSLKVEQLSVGANPNVLKTQGLVPTPQNVSTALIGNDVYVQNLLSITLNGIFIQFESPSSPVFLGKPGETYNLPFTKVFITTFGTANRWRLIIGNQGVSVQGGRDVSSMRQQLHLWDGTGIFDNPTNMPIPFSVKSLLVQVFDGTPVPSGFATTAFTFVQPTYGKTVFSNYDDGSGLSQQVNKNVLGTVNNKGYRIFWITNIRLRRFQSATTTTVFETNLIKAIAPPNNQFGASFTPPSTNMILLEAGVNSNNAATPTPGWYTSNITYNTPFRIVLAGFDTYDARNGGVQATGETLFVQTSLSSTDPGVYQEEIFLDGYYLPQLLPFNPYGQDPVLFQTQV